MDLMPMWTYQAERVVPSDPSDVHRAIDVVVADLWGDGSRVVVDDGVRYRTDAIAVAAELDDPDVWLTWSMEPVPEGTWVRLSLDEVHPGPDPSEALGEVLQLLAERLAVAS